MRRILSQVGKGFISRDSEIFVCKSALSDLRAWKSAILAGGPRVIPEIAPSDNYTLWSDASNEGWGAVLFDENTQQVWVTGERWPKSYLDSHINVKEAAALRLGLASFSNLSGKVVKPFIDNTSFQGALNKGYSPSIALNNELLLLDYTLRSMRIILLKPEYVKSKLNPADFWSRNFLSDTGEWALSD